jgi:acetyl-CoA carboxylase carboxyltransferase component
MTWQPELDDVRRRRDLAGRMGGPDKVRRQHEAGRLTVRERLAALLDDGSFDEIGTLAGTAAYDGEGELADFTPANFVTGTGRINGRKVVVGGGDFTIRQRYGGSIVTALARLDGHPVGVVAGDPYAAGGCLTVALSAPTSYTVTLMRSAEHTSCFAPSRSDMTRRAGGPARAGPARR